MSSASTIAQAIERHTRPLCRQYLLLQFEVSVVAVCDGGAARDRIARWAVGVLADGQIDVLGVSLDRVWGAPGWDQVFEELRARGVEQIQFIASSEHTEVRAGLRAAYSAATVLPSIGELLRRSLAQLGPRHRRSGTMALSRLSTAPTTQSASVALADLSASPCGAAHPSEVERWCAAVEHLAPLYSAAPRVRRLLLAGDEAAQRVAACLQRAVARHGCFPAEAAVTTFVSEALEHIDRGFDAASYRSGSHSRRRGRALSLSCSH